MCARNDQIWKKQSLMLHKCPKIRIMQINLIMNLIEILGRVFLLIRFVECGILPVFCKRREWETFIFARMKMIASHMNEWLFVRFFYLKRDVGHDVLRLRGFLEFRC